MRINEIVLYIVTQYILYQDFMMPSFFDAKTIL